MDGKIELSNIYQYIQSQNIQLTTEEESYLNTVWNEADSQTFAEDSTISGDKKLDKNEWVVFKNILQNKCESAYNKLLGLISSKNQETNYDYLNLHATIDPDRYSLKSLKKAFPEDRYNIEEINGSIYVTDKSTGNDVLSVSYKNGEYTIMRGDDYCAYNKDLKLSYHSNKNQNIHDLYDYSANTKSQNYGETVYDLTSYRLMYQNNSQNITRFFENGNYEICDKNTGKKVVYDKDGHVLSEGFDAEAFEAAMRNPETAEEFTQLISILNEDNVLELLNNAHSKIYLLNKLGEFYKDTNIPNDKAKSILDMFIKAAQKRNIYR